MGAIQFPPTPLGSEIWEQISTTTASGATVSFTSISGYRKLALLVENALATTSGTKTTSLQINSDTGNKYTTVRQTSTMAITSNSSSLITGNHTTTVGLDGLFVIDNCDSSTIKLISGWLFANGLDGSVAINPNSVYKGSATVSSIQFKTNDTFASGTITLYGVRA